MAECKAILVCISIVFGALLCLICVAYVIGLLFVNPSHARLSLSSTAVSPSSDWDVTVTFRNPNHMFHAYYQFVDIRVFHDKTLLGWAPFPSFMQSPRESNAVAVRAAGAGGRFVGDAKGLEVRVKALVSYRFFVWKTDWWRLRGVCADVPMVFNGTSNAGVMNGPHKECHVREQWQFTYG